MWGKHWRLPFISLCERYVDFFLFCACIIIIIIITITIIIIIIIIITFTTYFSIVKDIFEEAR